MSANTCSVRLSAELLKDARRDAEVFHRTISGQVEHWAELGRALEAANGDGTDRVRTTLKRAVDLKSKEKLTNP